MAISFDATTNINNIGAPSLTVSGSHTIGSGNNRIVFAFMSRNAGAISATYNGVAMVNSTVTCSISGAVTIIYYLINPPTGTNTVVITTTASSTTIAAIASYFGVDQISPINASNTVSSSSGSGTMALSVTTTINNSWVLGTARTVAAASLGGSGFTQRINQSNLFFAIDSNSPITPAGVSTATYNVDSATGSSQVLIAITPAVSQSSAALFAFF